MKKTVIAAGAVALLASLSIANAAEVTGRIRMIDQADHLITLSNGHQYSYIADPGEPDIASVLAGFHVGEKVRITHEGSAASGITPLN